MQIELILFIICAVYMLSCWIGYMFAIPAFDFFEKQCKNGFIWAWGATFNSVIWTGLLIFHPPEDMYGVRIVLVMTLILVGLSACEALYKVFTSIRLKYLNKRKDV